MKFTGRNLILIRDALEGAISDIQYQIGNCPDVVEYEGDLAILEIAREQFKQLAIRVDLAITMENI